MDPFEDWEALRVDYVYTPGLVRALGLSLPPPPEVVEVRRFLGRSTRHVPSVHTFFVLRDSGLEEAEGFVLRHLAGVARMRLALGVEADERVWIVDRSPVHTDHTPDAVWVRGERRVAIEYDAGYPKPILLEKLWGMAYRYKEQVWGVPTLVRKKYLESLLPKELRSSVRVVYAPWDSSP